MQLIRGVPGRVSLGLRLLIPMTSDDVVLEVAIRLNYWSEARANQHVYMRNRIEDARVSVPMKEAFLMPNKRSRVRAVAKNHGEARGPRSVEASQDGS